MSLKLAQGIFFKSRSKTTHAKSATRGLENLSKVTYKVIEPITRTQRIVQTRQFASKEGGNAPKPANKAALVPKKSLAPRFLMLGGAELNGKIPPAELDPTANVYLAAPPHDHEEDKDVSALLGVNAFYRSSQSFYMMKFHKNDTDMKLDDYVELAKLDFFSRTPYGTVSSVYINPALTEHLNQQGIIYTALFFDKKGRPDVIQRPAEMIFILKTPGGFWSITCHTSFFVLASQKDALFGNLLKNLRVELTSNEVEAPKESADSILLPKMNTIAKNRFRKRIKSTLTQRATIGEFGTINQESNLLPEQDDLLD
jgi:hypothetical protein